MKVGALGEDRLLDQILLLTSAWQNPESLRACG